MISISVCMIVKNEEKQLSKCLHSLKAIADEIIIVDTGSTDKTKEIAVQFTDKLFDFLWQDDFSTARNYALSKAGCEYIYTADADEVLDQKNIDRFLQVKQVLLPEIEVVEMAYLHKREEALTSNFEIEYRPKLFRRMRKFEFMDPIHEVLRTEPIVYRSDIEVYHYPLGNHGKRDFALFQHLAEKNVPFSGRLEMMYARELMLTGSMEDLQGARKYFQGILTAGSCSGDSVRRAGCILAKLAAQEGDAKALLDIVSLILGGGSLPAEICCTLGAYYLDQGNTIQSSQWYMAALSTAAPELVVSAIGREPLLGLAACSEKTGDQKQAAVYREQAASWNAEDFNPDK